MTHNLEQLINNLYQTPSDINERFTNNKGFTIIERINK
jgi:hypothetical protein